MAKRLCRGDEFGPGSSVGPRGLREALLRVRLGSEPETEGYYPADFEEHG